ncbi:DUF1464 domain-containing protein [Candidatus Bathyarchaeota archaeon]|nr:DUF1464 domain-containing protein [Candidatus Bathyarchaeota archaeon]
MIARMMFSLGERARAIKKSIDSTCKKFANRARKVKKLSLNNKDNKHTKVIEMVRVIGVDPGTGSWDVLGLDDGDGEDVFLDISIPSRKILENPDLLLSVIQRNQPVDMVTAPSGHGIPLQMLEDTTGEEIYTANLRRKKDPAVMGIAKVLFSMKNAGIKACTIPGVKQLSTVKKQYKYNKIDMGTADKVCSVAAAIVDQARTRDIRFEETSFILVEVGFGFNATIAVEKGKIIDGIGGSCGGMGFRACGCLDSEIAYLLNHISKKVIYSGGLVDIVGFNDLSPKELFLMSEKDEDIAVAVDGFFHDLIKDIMGLVPSFQVPTSALEVILSGREPEQIRNRLESKVHDLLSIPTRIINSRARISKTATQGAAYIANAVAGGKYKDLLKVMRLRESNHGLLSQIHVGPLTF